MNTSQLLVVSSVGLAVNLVGMLATGGHHHHGHSHGGVSALSENFGITTLILIDLSSNLRYR